MTDSSDITQKASSNLTPWAHFPIRPDTDNGDDSYRTCGDSVKPSGCRTRRHPVSSASTSRIRATQSRFPDGNAVLWRYMDLAKLLALVSKRSLFFPALDKLGDRFEGRWSNRTLEMIRQRDELWIRDRGDHVIVEDRRHDQHLEFPRLDPGWSVRRNHQPLERRAPYRSFPAVNIRQLLV